ncbi:MAG: hypothetical protein R3D00_02390 [Bacteroidia bacterium]
MIIEAVCTTGYLHSRVVVQKFFNEKNIDVWDTIVDISQLGVMMCGFDSHIWHGDTARAILINVHSSEYFKKRTDFPGTYCFTYMTFVSNKTIVMRTNEFQIER